MPIAPIILSVEAERAIIDCSAPGGPYAGKDKFYVLINKDGTLSRSVPEAPCDWVTDKWGDARNEAAKRGVVLIHMGTRMAHFYDSVDPKARPEYVTLHLGNGLLFKKAKVK